MRRRDAKPQNGSARARSFDDGIRDHPLYGTRIIISPLMVPDQNRAVYYEEELGPEMVAEDANAGEAIQGMGDDVQRVVRDYDVRYVNPKRRVIAKTTLPKVNTELSYMPGKDLAVVCRGYDHQRGYIWSFPVSDIQVDDTIIRVSGLKSLIRQLWPEVEEQFHDAPLMRYIDGVTLAADIPMTHNIIRKAMRQREIDRHAGLEW